MYNPAVDKVGLIEPEESMLCVPIIGPDGNVAALIQVAGRANDESDPLIKDLPLNNIDEGLLCVIAASCMAGNINMRSMHELLQYIFWILLI